ncbi:MAG: YHS domain-containing protein [Pirellulaceae bacterium]|nr:YHS domain-containing protein [Planctomycetales bacterium]
MKTIFRIFLPYSLLFGIIIAIFASHVRPKDETFVDEAMNRVTSASTELSRASQPQHTSVHPAGNSERLDPVCHMEVASTWGFSARYQDKVYHFCTSACRDRFVTSPEDFLGDRCVVCSERVDRSQAVTATYLGKTYFLCSPQHRSEFKSDAATFFMHTMWGIPPWMYYLSIGFVMIVSFGVFEGLGPKSIALAAVTPLFPALRPTAFEPNVVTNHADRIDLLGNRLFRCVLLSRQRDEFFHVVELP